MSTWTDERVDKLRELAAKGLSSAAIGRELGLSRNAVIGKTRRSGIRLQGLPLIASKGRMGKPITAHETPLPPPLPLPPPPPPTLPVTLLDLKDESCRWPIDGPDGTVEQRRFCGRGRSHGSYCEMHHKTAYAPPRAAEAYAPPWRATDSGKAEGKQE